MLCISCFNYLSVICSSFLEHFIKSPQRENFFIKLGIYAF